jgi:hypothetical protein
MSNIVTNLPLPPLYYHERETSYWRKDQSERWIKVNDSAAKSFIAEHAYSKAAAAQGTNSEVEKCLLEIQDKQGVAYVGPLAGHMAGVYPTGDNRILVINSPRFITPQPGQWPTLAALFEGMFLDGELDQRPYFYGWLKNGLESFRQRRWKASQLFAMAGPAGSGKSLTQNLITAIFGGRSSKPYQFMMGGTQFNSHMFGSEHLMLEDESESVDIRSRRHFAANIKTILTGRDQNCHAKHREALILNPIWRMSLSLNDDPERLQVLPPLDSDVRDKIIIVKVRKCEMPMATGSSRDDERFWNQMVSELPAFVHYLDNWGVPEAVADSRYGIGSFHHPEIVEKLEQTSPELRLLEFIDRELFSRTDRIYQEAGREPWEGTAVELETRLTNYPSQITNEARKLLTWQNSCGTYLGRLQDSQNGQALGRITSRKRNGQTLWTIQPPAIGAGTDEMPLPGCDADEPPTPPACLVAAAN